MSNQATAKTYDNSPIKCFGEYWSQVHVDWTSSKLLGKGRATKGRSRKTIEVNVANAVAIYCLFDQYEPVYVGKAGKTGLLTRLKRHATKDRHVGRWDAFSFYSLTDYNADGQLSTPRSSVRTHQAENLVGQLEALAIRLMDPKLNRRHEKLEGARQLDQVPAKIPALGIAELGSQLSRIEASIVHLENHQNTRKSSRSPTTKSP